jgi:membrane protein DedA with SNARE-associated domain
VRVIEIHGLLVLFLLSVVEGPIVTVIGGYLSTLGYLNVFEVYPVVVVADLIGDSICYALGRFGHGLVLKRWGPKFGVTLARMKKLEQHFRHSGGKTLILGKLTHSAGFIILISAGASRMSYGAFLWFNLLGTLPKSLFLLVLGYTLGYAYKDIDVYISDASFGALIVVAIGGLFYFVHQRRTKD